jgi:hypothetical protein
MPTSGKESERKFRWVMIIMELTIVTQPNNWLDASPDASECFSTSLVRQRGALIRAAASTQTLGLS